MAVFEPLRLVIDNYPDDLTEDMECTNHPQNPDMGTRMAPFSKVLYIEYDDFAENPPKKYKRLSPGREVRLRNAYVIKFASLVKDEQTGRITEVHCTYDPDTKNANPADGRKVDGVIHWVSADHSMPAEIRLYDRLYNVPDPASAEGPHTDYLNPDSLKVITAQVEPSLSSATPGTRFQFERIGYFCIDAIDSKPDKLVFNRIVPLRDSWAKIGV
jgi:glutaminyl-tRNA synthetase